ncbi:MAG: purine-binding chemotaxis protein CheW [Deltaproteobacteria bacterium]|nr:purine-binding chemotaxis protein CheW [Deltaproteobacteria bacterium]
MFAEWDEIKKKVELNLQKLSPGFQKTTEEKRRVFRERARKLAEVPKIEKRESQIEVLEFFLAKERYGIEASFIREVWPLREYASVPGTPSFFLGLANMRGELIAVIDLKRFLGLSPSPIPSSAVTSEKKLIVVSHEQNQWGLLADAVAGLRNVPEKRLQTSLLTLTGIRAEYLRGVTADRLAILDLWKMFTDKKMIA